mmetsp:Transcript_53709/g.174674  ORF Transcript_53709/g.174674 Transcript_53709/m.174674 type:complete len:288 (-) Transcript_53709:299-1162(-)
MPSASDNLADLATCPGAGRPQRWHALQLLRVPAQGSASYPPKDVNAANLAGVMWYLQHEVMITDPPKFGITRILRYKVQMRAPAGLLKKGMNFGVRYAYDSQKCTGPGKCDDMYDKYGYFVGCNKFESMYPYPSTAMHFAGGIWYSFPTQGACDASPTGAADCTYSYSWPPEDISLAELRAARNIASGATPTTMKTRPTLPGCRPLRICSSRSIPSPKTWTPLRATSTTISFVIRGHFGYFCHGWHPLCTGSCNNISFARLVHKSRYSSYLLCQTPWQQPLFRFWWS